jgi:glycosyltransferase involved in cell wall biosynthesis
MDYVLITPARNEAGYIEKTLASVAAQTVPPKRWVVVSDGSADATDDLVRRYQPGRDWLELLRLPEHRDRSFAAKVQAFAAGYERVRGLEFEVVGCLDADIGFEPDYFEFLLARFREDPRLGVAGTHYVEGDFHSYRDSYMNIHHVNGSCQLFRRACFEDIGGYQPIQGGGIDWLAVTTARMRGWHTRSFGERVFQHLRPIGTAENGPLKARFHYGRKDYCLGGHPLWELFRGGFQMARKPYLVGGLALWSGYLWSWLTRLPRPVSPELMAFYRQEQMERLRELLAARLRVRRQA